MSNLDPLEEFLASAGVSDWRRTRLPQDASTRYYLRLSSADQSAILMVTEPDAQFQAFIDIADLLLNNGLSAPKIKAQAAGLLLLEDLGEANAAEHLRQHPDDEAKIYLRVVEAISKFQTIKPAKAIGTLDAKAARNLAELFQEWCAPSLTPVALEKMEDAWRGLEPYDPVLSLRDLHAENIIWRPEQSGIAQIGLLDFQDAVVTHPIYDVVSLLRDARRDVQPQTVHAAKEAFLSNSTMSVDDFERAFATISVQRSLRILGIFRRLDVRDGRTKYRAFEPRIVSYLKEDLQHPYLAELKEILEPEIR